MNKVQNNKFRMFKAVEHYLNINLVKLEGFLAILAVIARLSANILKIETLESRKNLDNTGYTDSKKLLFNELIETCRKVTSGIIGWAIANKKPEIKKQFTKSKSDYKRFTEVGLLTFAESILTQAQEIGDALEASLVSAADVSNLTAKREEFKAIMNVPRTKRTELKEMTFELEELMQETSVIIKDELDSLMLVFENTDSAFFREYHSQRIIEDRGMRKKKTSDEIPADEPETPSEENSNQNEAVS